METLLHLLYQAAGLAPCSCMAASTSAVLMYGRVVRALRNFTQASLNKEPSWRHAGSQLTTGYVPPPEEPATAKKTN